MDKVLKHKFWILAGLVLPLALAGYFMANGGLKTATAERIAVLEGIQAPNPNQPNDTFTAKARIQADLQAQANAAQLNRLDKIQRAWMKWPAVIEPGLERKPETGEIAYRADSLKVDYRVKYPVEYERQLRELWLKLNPVIPSGLPFTSRNLTFCDIATIPRHEFPPGRIPTTQQIWDAQEDLWILAMLFEAINKTNAVAQYNVTDAAIREVSFIELFGGSGESTVTSAPDASGGMGGDGMEPTFSMESGTNPGLAVTFANGQAGFDPQEEYGSQAGAVDAAGGSGEPDGGLFGSSAGATKPLRYIAFDENNPGPYRRRGFYLSVLILERKIPDLITNLANLDPPILAGRWGLANNPYDTDHLLRAVVRQSGRGSMDNFEMSGGGGGGGVRGPRRPTRNTGFSDAYSSDMESGSGRRPVNPRDPLAMMANNPKMRAEVDALRSALQGKDLVQFDLSGVVTIFTPDVPVIISEEEEQSAEEAGVPVPEVPAEIPLEAPASDPIGTDPAATPPSGDDSPAPEENPPAAEVEGALPSESETSPEASPDGTPPPDGSQ